MLYGFIRDLNLKPSPLSFRSVCQRQEVRKKHRNYIKNANVHRRTRRQKLSKFQPEMDLLRQEGGRTLKSSGFGVETFSKPSRPFQFEDNEDLEEADLPEGLPAEAKP
ncbi:hypothetical protein LOD99_11120 [Oopsacas minuta]|uniref:Uncharacterized protein n=1 Tax=Oopsacas minuta TaxID=111878 RepID=A0AAV7KBD0_9METZ|nr:hypothetical protein LOD99_11120 [Oopsacas minuta]